MDTTALMQSAKGILWTQEAADWAQAGFTAIAILFTWWLARSQSQREEQEALNRGVLRGRGLALKLMATIKAWHAAVAEVATVDDESGGMALLFEMERGTLISKIGVPTEVQEVIDDLYELGNPASDIQDAVYIVE